MKNITSFGLVIILVLLLLSICYIVSIDQNTAPVNDAFAVCALDTADAPLEPIPEPAITYFHDPNLKDYTLEELSKLITSYEQIKANTEAIINAVASLQWSGDYDLVDKANVEKQNSTVILEVYQTEYNNRLDEMHISKWNVKKEEYPVATEIWLYMKTLGWNDYVCAGIMGNMMAEVGGQTLNIQHTSYNSTGFFYGICQWSKRYYSSIHGADLKTQCDFLRDTIEYEFNTFGDQYKYGFDFDDFLNLTDAKSAALAFAKCYERCGKGSYNVRKNNAITAYNYFTN